MSGKKTKLYGVGINDSKTKVRCRKTGFFCPYYSRWAHMIKRCYSKSFLVKNSTYEGCEVCDEWKIFSNFKAWMKKQEWEGMELDKDVIFPGNKIYCPERCAFIFQKENTLLCDSRKNRGSNPKGVCFHKVNKKFLAYITIDNKRKNLGSFDTSSEAYSAYKKEKKAQLIKASKKYSDKRVSDGFILHASLL